jgi:C4-dicarboxylate-specific signal transduction histidine kinase
MSEPQSPDWLALGRLAELGLLSASLVHEIRQPLTALKGLLQVESSAGGVHAATMATVLEQVAHIEDLLNVYGGYGRPIGSKATVVFLDDCVKAVSKVMAPSCARRGVSLQVEAEASQEVLASTVSVRQVLINVIQNALDASAGQASEGGVRVRTMVDGGFAWVVVRDHGLGMAPEALAHLGELFWTTKNEGEGTGLGLAIVHRLMEASGGIVKFEHPGDGGLEVWLGWPQCTSGVILSCE